MKKLTERQAKWNGGKWITPKRRLAIYLRDGMACCYCGAKVEDEDGTLLSLDHLKAHSHGGGNESTNLVTACKKCNSARGNRPVATFAKAVAAYLGTDAGAILRHVRNCSRRALPLDEAAELISRRKAA